METRKMGQELYLVFEKHHNAKVVQKYIEAHGLDGLSVYDVLDPIHDLGEALKEYSFLKRLHIHTVEDHDWSFLAEFVHLEDLSIMTGGKNTIDLSRLVALKRLSLKWRPQIIGFGALSQVRDLGLVEFKEKNLQVLSELSSLNRLVIKTSSIQSLSGIETFAQLEYLELGNCRRLESIAAINGLPFLNRIHLDSCTKVSDYHLLSALPLLDCLIMMDCKEIPSIGFLRNFPRLRYVALTGRTVVVDGDLSPMDDVEEAYCAPHKHYNRQRKGKK